jgi:tetratricopeptide (TPR) repeat protein
MAHNSLGTALLAQGQLNAAANKLAEALALTETLPDKPELDSVFGNLGTLAFKANRAKDAAEFWEQALLASPPGRKAIYLANLARLHQNEPLSPKFAELVAAALTAAEDKDTPLPAKADAWSLAALLAFKSEDLPKASQSLETALALDRQTENVSGLAQNLELAGQIQLKNQDYPQAAQSLDRAFYLYAALYDRPALKRLEGLLKVTHQKGYPKDLTPYQKILKNPEDFQPLAETCP